MDLVKNNNNTYDVFWLYEEKLCNENKIDNRNSKKRYGVKAPLAIMRHRGATASVDTPSVFGLSSCSAWKLLLLCRSCQDVVQHQAASGLRPPKAWTVPISSIHRTSITTANRISCISCNSSSSSVDGVQARTHTHSQRRHLTNARGKTTRDSGFNFRPVLQHLAAHSPIIRTDKCSDYIYILWIYI